MKHVLKSFHHHRPDQGAAKDARVAPESGGGAFTLVELLIVIGIIAVLAGLIFPLSQRALDASRGTKCTSQLRDIGLAFYTFAADNDGTLPAIDRWQTLPNSPKPREWDFWITQIRPYVSDKSTGDKLFRCPQVYHLQPKNPNDQSPWRYSLNQNIGVRDLETWWTLGVRGAALGSPSKKVMVFCSGAGWTSMTRDQVISGGYGPITASRPRPHFAEVHNNKAHVLFGDGHVGAEAFTNIPPENWRRD